MGLLIDSTVLIHAERHGLPPVHLLTRLLERFGDQDVAMSVMTAGELFHGCWRADSPSRRARREEYVESVLAAVPAVPLTLATMRAFGQICARLSAAGERVPTSDLLIASTAIVRRDTIVTGNRRHFDRVAGLSVVDF